MDGILVGSGIIVFDSREVEFSVCLILYSFNNLMVIGIRYICKDKAEFIRLEISSFKHLGAAELNRCGSNVVLIVEYDGGGCSLGIGDRFSTLENAVVIRYCNSNRIYVGIVGDLGACTDRFLDRILVGSCLGIRDSREGEAAVCLVGDDFGVALIVGENEAEFTLCKRFAVKLLDSCKGNRSGICGISILEYNARSAAYACRELSGAVVGNSNRNGVGSFIVLNAFNASFDLAYGVGVNACLSIGERFKAEFSARIIGDSPVYSISLDGEAELTVELRNIVSVEFLDTGNGNGIGGSSYVSIIEFDGLSGYIGAVCLNIGDLCFKLSVSAVGYGDFDSVDLFVVSNSAGCSLDFAHSVDVSAHGIVLNRAELEASVFTVCYGFGVGAVLFGDNEAEFACIELTAGEVLDTVEANFCGRCLIDITEIDIVRAVYSRFDRSVSVIRYDNLDCVNRCVVCNAGKLICFVGNYFAYGVDMSSDIFLSVGDSGEGECAV